jgi:hypothetical protein
MLRSAEHRRTVAVAVSFTLGAAIIIVVAVVKSLSRARRLAAAAAALQAKEGGLRSSWRGPLSREAPSCDGKTRRDNLLSEASLDGSERSSRRGTTRLASLDAYAPRHTQLLAVAVDADDDDFGYEPPQVPEERVTQLQSTQLDGSRWTLNNPRINPVTRGSAFGALTGCEAEEAAAAQVDIVDAPSPRAAGHTPRSSAWRAPALLGGDGDDADDGNERAPRASIGSRLGLRSNSGRIRTRRSSITNEGQY